MGVRIGLITDTPDGMSASSHTVGFIMDFLLDNTAFSLVSDTELSSSNERTVILTCGTNPHSIKISSDSSGYINIYIMDLAGTTPLVTLFSPAWYYSVFAELHAYEGAYNFCLRSPDNGSTVGSLLKYSITDDSKYWLWVGTSGFYGEGSDTAYALDAPMFTKRVDDGSLFTIQPKLYTGSTYTSGKTQEMYAFPTTLDGYVFPNVLTNSTDQFFVVTTNLIFKV